MRQTQAMDEGMPAERTLLSWRRTTLTLSIACFALARLALSESVLLAELLIAIALVRIVTVVINSARHYKGARGASGTSTFAIAATAFSLGVIEIILMIRE
ncbi:MAG: DUF202 domain-containing protein [Actinomycetia bacterium]|nr:DUF202 domain-containing protein [Actinomycetes bacterium]